MIQALTIQHKRTAHGISLGYVTALAGLTILQLAYYVFGFVDVPDTTFPDFELDPRPLVFLKPTLTELMCGAQLMAQFLGSFFMFVELLALHGNPANNVILGPSMSLIMTRAVEGKPNS
jgi:hypothetical protein